MGQFIIEDTRQQAGKHEKKHEYFGTAGITYIRCKLPFGDYASVPPVVVDTKASVAEIAMNINGREHERFKRECVAARDAGSKLYVLVENIHGYTSVDDVMDWENDECRRCMKRKQCNPYGEGKCSNPRHKKSSKKPIQGVRLSRAMRTMEDRYGVTFLFCSPLEAGQRVMELIGGGVDE